MMNKFTFFIISLFFTQVVFADLNYKLDFNMRSQPFGTNIVGTAQYDHSLWGEVDKSKPLYGYARAGVKAGGSPTVAGFIQVAPIAPLILEVSKSKTYRFLDSKEFNCSTYECKKSVDRLDFTTRLVFGYKNFFGTTAINFRDVKTAAQPKLMALEFEYFSVPSGRTHSLVSKSLVLGQKYSETLTFGLLYEHSEIAKLLKRAEFSMGFVRAKYYDIDWLFGASHYSSNERDMEGNGIVIGVSKSFGETLGLM